MSENKSTDPIPEIEQEDGWGWFEKQNAEAKSVFQDRLGMDNEEITAHFQKCFSTASGKIVLEYLDVYANDIRDFDPSLGFYNGAAFGFYRSGQKSFMSMIRAFLRRDLKAANRAKGK